MAGKLALEFLAQSGGVLGNLVTELFAQGVEVLCQPPFPGVQLRLEIAPRCLLRPESEDTQECGGERGLLVFRKPSFA